MNIMLVVAIVLVGWFFVAALLALIVGKGIRFGQGGEVVDEPDDRRPAADGRARDTGPMASRRRTRAASRRSRVPHARSG